MIQCSRERTSDRRATYARYSPGRLAFSAFRPHRRRRTNFWRASPKRSSFSFYFGGFEPNAFLYGSFRGTRIRHQAHSTSLQRTRDRHAPQIQSARPLPVPVGPARRRVAVRLLCAFVTPIGSHRAGGPCIEAEGRHWIDLQAGEEGSGADVEPRQSLTAVLPDRSTDDEVENRAID